MSLGWSRWWRKRRALVQWNSVPRSEITACAWMAMSVLGMEVREKTATARTSSKLLHVTLTYQVKLTSLSSMQGASFIVKSHTSQISGIAM